MKKWQKLIENITDELGWYFNLEKDGKSIFLEIYSPAGQDCCLEIEATNFDDFKYKVREYYEGYDPDEETALWYGAKRGEPSSLRDLLNDMEWYDNKLKELSDKLDEYEK